MLQENIKTFRKERGLTQEELAIRVNVVRQTVSKWEKGLSVPDAELMQRIAEVLEVSVSQLLGEEKEMEKGRNEIAEQLARINEQLAIKNRRAKRLWTIAGAALAVLLVVQGTAMALSMAPSEDAVTYTFVGTDGELQVLEDQDGSRITITKVEEGQYTYSAEEE